jgi:hypothetical protein
MPAWLQRLWLRLTGKLHLCQQCHGTGKELASYSLSTGNKEYRTCSACEGSGVAISTDKQFFTQDPAVSLQNARALIGKLGKPIEVRIEGNHNVLVRFKNGSRYILGGFTVGYRETGPEYTKRFLDAAGFSASIDEIAEMNPPVVFSAPSAT